MESNPNTIAEAALRELNRKLTEERAEDNGFAQFGGYMDAKISKLDQQFVSGQNGIVQQSDLFAGISIFVNGRTNPSADELKRIMMANGGVFHHYERSSTKFIIANNLPDVKIRNHTTKTIIRPEFIVDCLREKRILDHKNYLLVTNVRTNQPKITFQSNSNIPLKAQETEQKPELELCANLSIINKYLKFPKVAGDISKTNTLTKNQARTANDPKFLSEFYNNSRLHHISTLGATFKQYITTLREEHTTGLFPAREELSKHITINKEWIGRDAKFIMHIDMDCFFVSVGLRNRPDLVGQPVAVTHSKGNVVHDRPGVNLEYELQVHQQRLDDKFQDTSHKSFFSDLDKHNSLSEIASCSYEARAHGLKNGMFVGQAMKLCPNLKTIPYDFDGYKEVAYILYNTIAKFTLNIEAVSCDEMYVDLSDLVKTMGIVDPMEFVNYVREEIKTTTGCPCSAGVGSNRIQARMATKKAKPNGQFYLEPEAVLDFFKGISTSDLPGVGRSNSHILAKFNWNLCGDLQGINVAVLQRELGKKTGQTLHELAHGIDTKPLNYGQIRKSVSAEVNYGIRFSEMKELETFLDQLCREVQSRLTEIKKRGKCVTLKYMVRAQDAPVETAKFMGHGICDSVNKSHTSNDYFDDFDTIFKTVLLLNKSLNIAPAELRGIGIQITKLEEKSDQKRPSKLLEMFSKVEVKIKKNEVTQVNTVPEVLVAKSPAKRPSKSPQKPLRGRPRKGANFKSKNITEMLKPSAHELDIDENVLNELPEDMRQEAVRSHKIIMKRYKSESKIEVANNTKLIEKQQKIDVNEEFLAALPLDIRREIEEEMRRNGNNASPTPSPPCKSPIRQNNLELSSENIFGQNNWRSLLAEWIESSDQPDATDLDMIIENTCEFIQARRIEEVSLHFRYLHRILGDVNSCDWHRAYFKVTESIQMEMLKVFGNKLAIKSKVCCNKCE